jgi:hypothetical protein
MLIVSVSQIRPDWLKMKIPSGENYVKVKKPYKNTIYILFVRKHLVLTSLSVGVLVLPLL